VVPVTDKHATSHCSVMVVSRACTIFGTSPHHKKSRRTREHTEATASACNQRYLYSCQLSKKQASKPACSKLVQPGGMEAQQCWTCQEHPLRCKSRIYDCCTIMYSGKAPAAPWKKRCTATPAALFTKSYYAGRQPIEPLQACRHGVA
jgi:hypothetical protein